VVAEGGKSSPFSPGVLAGKKRMSDESRWEAVVLCDAEQFEVAIQMVLYVRIRLFA